MTATQTVRLWAPFVASVSLATPNGDGQREEPMQRAESGWWTSEREVSGRYRFVVDGQTIADPRSHEQPDGLDGWSEVVDDGAFEWHDAGWTGFDLASAVIYELHVGTFTVEGTFDGVAARLDHLVGLGVDAIELMPVATGPGNRGWGYDGVAMFAPQDAYGGSAGLARLVDACHGRGIAVILDVVYNHVGPSGNHLHLLGPYFTDRHHTPWGEAINFDSPESGPVREFVIDNALHWIVDLHLDGLRLDAVHAIVDDSPTHILQDITAAVHDAGGRLGRITWVIAESDLNDPRLVAPVSHGGYGLDAAWSDDFHHALHVALTDERVGILDDFDGLTDLVTALEEVFVFAGRFSPARGVAHGHPVGALDRHHFIVFAQNHDQIGNRAAGDRLGHLVVHGRQAIAAAVVMTAPFVPLLFQGEEWGASTPFQYFTDHEDPALVEAVQRGRRQEFAALFPDDADGGSVPDPQDSDTMRRSTLDWSELADDDHAGMLAWYRSLIALRRSEPSLSDGSVAGTHAVTDADAGWLRVERGSIVVVVNLGPTQAVPLAVGEWDVVLSSDPGVTLSASAAVLPADSVAILRAGDPCHGPNEASPVPP